MTAPFPGFELLSTISTGPVRAVHRARHVALDRRVVIVTLAEGILPSSSLSRALRREAEALGRLDHPNLVRLHEFHETPDRLWFVLDDEIATPLTDKQPPFAPDVAIALGLLVARGLRSAHERGVFHGRLTTSDVGITTLGALKVSGFGQIGANDGESEPLEWSQAGGASPERTLGQPPTALGDVFALGALLYEWLTGVEPFGPSDATDYPARVRNGAVVPTLAHTRAVPPAVDRLVRRALEKLPGDRPESMLEFARELGALLGDDPEKVVRAWALELADREAPPLREGSLRKRLLPSRAGSVVPLLVACVVTAAGGAFVVGRRFDRKRDTATAAASIVNLAPENALSLRAVATPWAHVLVDGKHVETTPFAQPILLSPGAHVVRFEHPQALAEERSITGEAGQSVFLDVALHVKPEPVPADRLPLPDDDTP